MKSKVYFTDNLHEHAALYYKMLIEDGCPEQALFIKTLVAIIIQMQEDLDKRNI